MLRNWLRNLVNRKSSQSRRNGRVPARFRPRLEGLEKREVLATVRWAGALTGDFATAANWDTRTVPGPNDDVIIASSAATTVTHNSGNHTVKSLVSTEAFTMTGGTLTVTANSSFGATLTLTGGTLIARANVGVDRLILNKASTGMALLDGPGIVTVDGLLTFRGGRIGGTGSMSARGGIRFEGTFAKVISRNLHNSVSAEWFAGPISIANAAGQTVAFTNHGTFTVRGSNLALTTLSNTQGGGDASFFNIGTVTKVANTGTTTITGYWDNSRTGRVIIEASTVTNGQNLRISGYSDGPTIQVGANATLSAIGKFELEQGVSITGAGKVHAGSVIGASAVGTLVLNNANVAVTGEVRVNSGSKLVGAGTVATNLVNNGSVDPGFYLGGGRANPGTITVTGDYTQAANALLYVAITPTGNDQLRVSGRATLGGTLAVEGLGFIDSRPTFGTTYLLVTYGSRVGYFARMTDVVLPGIPSPYLPATYIRHQNPSHGATGISYEVFATAS